MPDRFVMPILREMRSVETFTWEATKEHRDWALANHGQTLERLRERGGLAWVELYCVIAGVKGSSVAYNDKNREIAKAWLLAKYPQAG